MHALGPLLSAAARECAEETQAPIELVAHHLLTLGAMAAQRAASLELPTGRQRPLSCYFLTIAGPGEPRSAADEIIIEPLRAWEEESRFTRDPECPIDQDVFWTAPPRTPDRYARCRGQYGLFAQQSADVIARGSRRAQEAVSLSALWEGRPESFTQARVFASRLSVHLVAAPHDAGRLLADPDVGDSGLLDHLLSTSPASRIGGRTWRPADAAGSLAYDAVYQRLVADYAAEDTAHARVIALSDAAKAAWFSFAAEVEAAMGSGGPLAPIVGLATCLPEHAARLAAVIALMEDSDLTELGVDALARGIALARFYAWEALRIADVVAPGEAAQAEVLFDWLQRTWAGKDVSLRDICRSGPNAMRARNVAYRLMCRLERVGSVNAARAERRRGRVTYLWPVPAAASAEQLSPDVA